MKPITPRRDKQLGVRVPRELYRQLRIAAAYAERPMADLIEEALEQYLARRRRLDG